MIDDQALEEWAKGYATRIRAEGREKFPGDGHAQNQYALQNTGPALRRYHEETGKDAPEELWYLVDRWHIILSDAVLHREMYPEGFTS